MDTNDEYEITRNYIGSLWTRTIHSVSPLVILHSRVLIVVALVQTTKDHELLGLVSIPKIGITILISCERQNVTTLFDG